MVGGDIGAARPWAATSGAVRSAVGCSALVPIRGGFCGPAFEQLARGFLENRHGKEREVREGFLVNFVATVRSETKGQKSICAFVHLSWLVHTIRCLFLSWYVYETVILGCPLYNL